jgi:hypothetical protein
MKKVYVLEYLRDLAAEKPSANVLGVFKSEEEAQEVMKQGFREIYDELNVTEEDIASDNTEANECDKFCYIFYYNDYYEWHIYEFEI